MINFIDPSKFYLAFIGCSAMLLVLADWLCCTKMRLNIFLGVYGFVGVVLLVMSISVGMFGGVQAIISYLIIGGLYSKAKLAVIDKSDIKRLVSGSE